MVAVLVLAGMWFLIWALFDSPHAGVGDSRKPWVRGSRDSFYAGIWAAIVLAILLLIGWAKS